MNTIDNNVIYVDTTGYVNAGPAVIGAVKYIGTTGATVTITAGVTGTGAKLYQSAVPNEAVVEEVEIIARKGFHVAVTGGAAIYIYLE